MGGLSNPSDAESGFSAAKVLWEPQASGLGQVAAAGTYVLVPNGISVLTTAGNARGAIYLDPADHAAGSRTAQISLRATIITCSVAPGAVNFTFGVYPVTAFGGGSNASPSVTTVGAATCSVVRASPSASTAYSDTTSWVTFPAAGFYVCGMVTDAATAALSQEMISMRVFYRQV